MKNKNAKTQKPVKPELEMSFSEINGNAFGVLAKVEKCLRMNGYSKEQIAQYRKEATSGGHANLLKVTENWVELV